MMGAAAAAVELGEVIRKYSLPTSTNKAALKRVLDRLEGQSTAEKNAAFRHERRGGASKPRSRPPSATASAARRRPASASASASTATKELFPPSKRTTPRPQNGRKQPSELKVPSSTRTSPRIQTPKTDQLVDAYDESYVELEQILQSVEDRKRNRSINEIKSRLNEAKMRVAELEAEGRTKDTELRKLRATTARLRREKLIISSPKSSKLLKNGQFRVQELSDEGGRRGDTLINSFRSMEIRAVKAESEALNAYEENQSLMGKVEELSQRLEEALHRNESANSDLKDSRERRLKIEKELENTVKDIAGLQKIALKAVAETASLQEMLENGKANYFKLQSINSDLLQNKIKKDKAIYALESKVKQLNAKHESSVVAKQKLVDHSTKLEDRMAMLRKRNSLLERRAENEEKLKEQAWRETKLKEEECQLLVSMVASPNSAVRDLQVGQRQIEVKVETDFTKRQLDMDESRLQSFNGSILDNVENMSPITKDDPSGVCLESTTEFLSPVPGTDEKKFNF